MNMKTWDGETRVLVGVLFLLAASWVVFPLAGLTYRLIVGVDVGVNPVVLIFGFFQGRTPGVVGVWALVYFFLLISIVVVIRMCVRPKRQRGDEAAARTGGGAVLRSLTAAGVAKKAKYLKSESWGLPIGETIRNKTLLFSDMEAVCVNISGPRTGKTTCWCVPRILAAKGAVVVTSNKRDIVDSTRIHRSSGARVWVFDPQKIVDEPQGWFWNPLSYVTDAVTATNLAQVFVDTTRSANATTNAYFDGAAKDLVASMLLAAASANLTLLDVHRWLNAPTDQEPVRLLRSAGYRMMAQALQSKIEIAHETRSGVYGSASQIMSFLLNEQALAWATPQAGLEEFSPEHFVASNETLYCLSQEGKGSATPIVTALTVAVVEAALEYARRQEGGRFARPMLIELDEAANVCRWRDLPDLYSHFGSRGILVDTVLQSWSQGVAAWGESGMKKLWSAANVKVYGGGVSERDFLSQLSDLIGTWWDDSIQYSTSSSGRSMSRSVASQQKPIATVADLASLPPHRAWIFASGAIPALVRLIPFWESDRKTRR